MGLRAFLAAVLAALPPPAFPAEAAAGGSSPEGVHTVTLGEFLKEVPRTDLWFHRILLEGLDARYRSVLVSPAGDWILEVLGDYTAPAAAAGAGEGGGTVALSRLIPSTGTTLSAQISESGLGTGARTRGWEVTLAQDIAKNAFGRAARLDTAAANLEAALARHQVVEAYEDYLARLASTYLDWYLAFENAQTARNALEESRKLLENLRERLRRNVALPVDVEKVRLQVVEREERLVQLEATAEIEAHQVRRALALPVGAPIRPADPTDLWKLAGGLAENLEAFQRHSRTAEILRLVEERGGKALARAADDLLPSLRLRVSLGSAEPLPGEPAEREVSAGVQFSFPLGRPHEKARRHLVDNELERAHLEARDVMSRVRTDLRNLYLKIRAEERRLALAEERITLAARILREERENYALGRTDLNELIRFANSLEETRFARLARSVERSRLLLEWLRLSDRLVEERDLSEAR